MSSTEPSQPRPKPQREDLDPDTQCLGNHVVAEFVDEDQDPEYEDYAGFEDSEGFDDNGDDED